LNLQGFGSGFKQLLGRKRDSLFGNETETIFVKIDSSPGFRNPKKLQKHWSVGRFSAWLVRITGYTESAGINRHVVGDARALQERK
jgi:hypothetical protein